MKQESNDKDSKNLELTPHTQSSCGYALPLVEGEQSPKNEGAKNGSVLGCNANTWNPNTSVRTANCNNHAGNGNDNYVGSWSLTKENNNIRTSFPARENITEGFAATGAQGQCDYGSLPYWDEENAESNAGHSKREFDIFNKLREANKKRKLKSLKQYLTNIQVIEFAFDRTMERTHAPKKEKSIWIAKKNEVCKRIQNELINQTYHPKPTTPREIKPRNKGGKVRHAEISAMYDRIVANLFYVVIEHKFRVMLIRNVYSGVKGRSLLSNDKRYCMINVIRHWVDTHRELYVGQTDIKHFYENLQTKIVIGIMFKTIVCPFARWMLVTMFEKIERVPIGGCLSQLMAMIAINDCDRELLRRYGVFLCCFGDNRLIGGSKEVVRQAMSYQMSYYEGALNLTVKKDYHINKVSDGFTFCKYRFHHSFVSVRAEIRRRAIRAKRRGQQHYAGYKGMLLKTDSKHLRDLIENNYMELVNRHGMTITTQRGDKLKFRDLDEHSEVIPYEYKILQSKAALADGKPMKYYVELVYILMCRDGKHRLCHTTEGSEEIVQFFRLVDEDKVTLHQALHICHQGTQSYFEEYHTSKQEACDLICKELGLI